MERFGAQLAVLWSNVFEWITFADILDVAILAILIYYLLLLTRETRASQVLKGIGVAFVGFGISYLLNLAAIQWVLTYVMNAGALVLVVLFQPELRKVLESLGRRTKIERSLDKGSLSQVDQMIEEIVRAFSNLSKRRVGALVVVEHKTLVGDIIETGTILDAVVSAALLENIFEPNTPLHDGAIVIRQTRIVSAGCFLPLTEETSISKQLGTRHRAALGVTETSDAIALVVSEETGTISMAKGGRLTRHLDADGLREALRGVYDPVHDTKLAGLMPAFLKKWRGKE